MKGNASCGDPIEFCTTVSFFCGNRSLQASFAFVLCRAWNPASKKQTVVHRAIGKPQSSSINYRYHVFGDFEVMQYHDRYPSGLRILSAVLFLMQFTQAHACHACWQLIAVNTKYFYVILCSYSNCLDINQSEIQTSIWLCTSSCGQKRLTWNHGDPWESQCLYWSIQSEWMHVDLSCELVWFF